MFTLDAKTNVFIPVWYFVLALLTTFFYLKASIFFSFDKQTFIKYYREIFLLLFRSKFIKFSNFATAIALKHFIEIAFFGLICILDFSRLFIGSDKKTSLVQVKLLFYLRVFFCLTSLFIKSSSKDFFFHLSRGKWLK